MKLTPWKGWEWEVDNAECGDLQFIQYIAAHHPDLGIREMWLSVFMGELSVLGIVQ